MKRILDRLSFSSRMAVGIFALSLLLTGSGGLFYYYSIYNLVINQLGARLKDVGRTGAYLFGPEERSMMERLALRIQLESAPLSPADLQLGDEDTLDSLTREKSELIMKSPDFQAIVQRLRQIKAGSQRMVQPLRTIPQASDTNDEPLVRFAYLLVAVPESPDYSATKFLADADYEALDLDRDGAISDEEAGNPAGTIWKTPVDAFKIAFAGEAVAAREYYTDKWGTWLSAAVPLKSSDGRVIAVLGLDYNMRDEASLLNYFFRITLAMLGVGLVLSAVLAFGLARILSRRLRVMAGAVEKLAERDFSVRVPHSSSRDELGRLGRAFNSMVEDIRSYSEGLAALNIAFERFVPRQFLKQMGHDTVLTVSLGDQVQKKMSVMFCDIRAFTTLSETMSPKENFNFLNEYLSRISPIIRENHGFIDKYIGDAIMALFPARPADALNAAVQMMLELALFNADRREAGLSPVRFGIGVHYGDIMLGTVGEEERMDGTVISDAVNVAARLESLTKKYHTALLASEEIILAAEAENRQPFTRRYLGSLRLRGRARQTKIFEILDGLPQKERAAKLGAREKMEAAIHSVQSGAYAEALRVLRLIVAEFPEDTVARALAERLSKITASSAA